MADLVEALYKHMKFYKDGDSYVVILKLGEELFGSLANFATQNNLKTAWFEAFGATKEVELGYYNLEAQKYVWRVFSGPLEITGLQGNIAQKDGQPVFHAHGSFADESYNVVGGHIKKLVVAGTCELFITPLNLKLTRQLDDEVGLELLQAE
ncbi:hypothetical protein A3F05_02595 [Candidatus Saccharibacteria bacterium RIFCSPHIGHO2_12_FULL_47_17]|nr:MAG: hypothetical protein A3F05_02595 [Candidatus Saccharibacteria bacterium RIFCSPHIGHO2_12_FULL_47_17]